MPREPLQLVINIDLRQIRSHVSEASASTYLPVCKSSIFAFWCFFFRPFEGGRLAYYFGKWQLMVGH